MRPFEDHERKRHHVHHFGPSNTRHVPPQRQRQQAGKDWAQDRPAKAKAASEPMSPVSGGRTLMNVGHFHHHGAESRAPA